jgi:hypothetical protein
MSEILLGYEVPTGDPVRITVHHTAIFGMTQHGKTTALEALIMRSKMKAIAFIVKRGEGGFHDFNQVVPYYKPRSDWQYVEGLLNVALREKVQYQPFMRWAILQVTKKRPANLREVLDRSRECETTYPRRKEVFEQLSAYLEIVVPELEKQVFATSLELKDGVNVMDLVGMSLEVQQIVIASTIEFVFKNLDHVIVIIPEAWESLPNAKMTPIKWIAETFVRKGAVLHNYLWLDSQDIGGIDKTPLRQCDNWIMGRMKEAHEVARIIKTLLGAKIHAEEIQTLPLGTFFSASGNTVRKVYVLPANVPENMGIEVAKGQRSPDTVREFLKGIGINGSDDEMFREKYEESEKRVRELQEKLKLKENEVALIREQIHASNTRTEKEFQDLQDEMTKRIKEINEKDARDLLEAQTKIEDYEKKLKATDMIREGIQQLIGPFQANNATLSSGPNGKVSVNLQDEETSFTVSHTDKNVELSTTDESGKVILCALRDLPKEGFTYEEMRDALNERGWTFEEKALKFLLNVRLRQGGLLIPIILGRGGKKYRIPGKVKMDVKE